MSNKNQNITTVTSLKQLKERYLAYQKSLSAVEAEKSQLNNFIYFLNKIDKRTCREIGSQLGLSGQRVGKIVKTIEEAKS